MNHNLQQKQDVINSVLNINAVKSAAEVIIGSMLEVGYNLDDSFCDTQDLKQSQI